MPTTDDPVVFTYKNRGGPHIKDMGGGVQRIYKPGAVFEDTIPLHERYANKFEVLKRSDGKPIREEEPNELAGPDFVDVSSSGMDRKRVVDAEKAAAEKAERGVIRRTEVADDAEGAPARTEVTADFPDAAKAELRVFKVGDEYFVTETDDTERALNADRKLVNPKAVEKFVKTFQT